MKQRINFLYVCVIVLVFFSSLVYGAIPAKERAALIALYNSTNGDNWTDNSGWKTPPLHTDGFAKPGTEGSWRGVIVDNIEQEDHVINITFYNNNLTGNIPPEIGDFSKLDYLFLNHNDISGEIPKEIGNLNSLKNLYLGWNELEGTIPAELFNLTNLSSLFLGGNNFTGVVLNDFVVFRNLEALNLSSCSISGSIPGELGTLTNLSYLSLYANNLSGSIPSELFNLINLKTLILSSNDLTGIVSSDIGNLKKLEYLSLSWNNLSGNLPIELFDLINLKHLYLGGNGFSNVNLELFSTLTSIESLELNSCNLSGSIPAEFFNLNNLETLWLDSNELSGNIPINLVNLTNLRSLKLNNNNFTGSIPEELFNLNLEDLALHSNDLSGNIPKEIGNLTNLTFLSLSENRLTGSIPKEIGDLDSLKYLYLYYNNLSGNIPMELGNLINLKTIRLDHNKLIGEIPTTLTNLVNLEPGQWVDFGYNCLYADDSELRAWLDSVDPDWESHQNECGFNLIVQSSPDTGVPITVSPDDNYGQGNGNTEFFRTYDADTVVTLTAPTPYNGKFFVKWLIDGNEDSNRTVQVTMDSNHTAQAVYQSVTYTLTVRSSPSTGVGITVTPNDNSGNGDGDTNFTRIYDSGTNVTLTAPSSYDDNNFVKWTVDGNNYTEKTIQFTMDSDHTAVVYYGPPPEISVNRSRLNFGYIIGSSKLPVESFTIFNSGGGTLNWSVSTEMHRVGLNPESGTGNGGVSVSISPVGLPAGKFKGVVYISDSLASNSPVEVEVYLWVKSQPSQPFGDFSTPGDGSTVSSSVPVTGWALGDTGIESVKIYHEDGKSLVYIGDAGFVEGARPDIETEYPDYPMNHKAGWGYMMLTNFLPNGGNGEFTIHAIATDKEGQTSTLGVKTITVDNANAVKPFGAIDTPTQGGTASGSNYRNQGWVLTPPPNKIAEDGSTINVYVDGVDLGNPVYNVYREDIANYFPGYANSDGAHAYFDFDTTTYENGVHTIFWTATDNAGNADGIGSRYFNIQNVQGARSMEQGVISNIPIDYYSPVGIRKGYRKEVDPEQIYPDDNGIINVEINELERLEVHLGDLNVSSFITHHSSFYSGYSGYQLVGDQFKPLPIGSTLDMEKGIFYWLPGPGFVGEYEFVFLKGEGKVRIKVRILPKFSK
jgi:Leucine-rich repeat (LRR) protein